MAIGINCLISLGFITFVTIETYAQAETAAERLHNSAYELPFERGRFFKSDPIEFPIAGQIQFKDFSLRYRDNLPYVLKGINITINPGFHLRRTGSGKSSLILALFDLYTTTEGTIEIDGYNIRDLGLYTLRGNIGIIPQDPFIFSGNYKNFFHINLHPSDAPKLGTILFNIDPMEQFDKEKIKSVIQRLNLQKTFNLSVEQMLNFEVSERGNNLSEGQKQLLCIARILIRNPKIVVLDEATAHIDTLTDKKIQSVVREYFAGKTVLTIAHRIDTILDSTKILLLGDGKIVEFDSPKSLLANKDSMFNQFYRG